MTKIDDIEHMGYTVEKAFSVEEDGETINVYRVEGFGLSTMVRGDDIEQLTMLESSENHAERVKQLDETVEETLERFQAEGLV